MKTPAPMPELTPRQKRVVKSLRVGCIAGALVKVDKTELRCGSVRVVGVTEDDVTALVDAGHLRPLGPKGRYQLERE